MVAHAVLFYAQVSEDLGDKGVQIILFQQTILNTNILAQLYTANNYLLANWYINDMRTHLLNIEECIEHVAEFYHLELAQVLMGV